MSHSDTPEQAAVIAWKGERLVVCAFAGSGKTTTLRRFAKEKPTERMLYIAYNCAIRDEAEHKFLFNVTCKASHQLAWPTVGKHYSHRLINILRLTDVARALNSRNWLLARLTLDVLNCFMCSATTDITPEHIPDPEDCKGLEWDRVKLHDDFPDILDPDMPESQRQDEINLMYVAATRARKVLITDPILHELLLRLGLKT